MNNYTMQEKSRLMIEETIAELRDKPVKSTYMERMRCADKAYELYSAFPQPLYLGYGLTYMLENVSVPIKEHDILLGRVVEWVPNDEEEAWFQEAAKRMGERKYFMVDGGHISLDWETILNWGLGGYIAHAEAEIEKRIAEGAAKQTIEFLEGMVLVYKAYRRYIIRYAEAAEAAGMKEAAEVSRNIADNPPKTFHEAIQLLLYITHIYSVYAAHWNATLAYGRVDDLLCRYYEADLAAGILTRDEAAYMIDDFNCKSAVIMGRGEHQMSGGTENETGWIRNPMYDSPTYAMIGGYSNFRDHKTNPLTLLFAERIHPRFENPVYVFRRTNDDDDAVWETVCDKLRQNSTLLIYNDETCIKAFENAGVEPFDAINYTIHGCNWPDVQGLNGNLGSIGIPLPKIIMNAMFDAEYNLKREFTSMDDVYAAAAEEYAATIKPFFDNYRKKYYIDPPTLPTSLNCTNCFMRGTIEHANTIHNGAAKYFGHYTLIRNIGTAADILAGLDTVVFGDDPIPMDVLADALKNDFVGYEALQKRMKQAPKYGRDDDGADKHAVRMMTTIQDKIDEMRTNPETGKKDILSFNVTITDMWHVREGSTLGATPDGRNKGQPLSENLSPAEGNSESVTALLNTVSKLPFDRITAGALNIRMPKNLVNDDEGLMRLKILLDTYFENGGMQLQFSAADTAELRDAQLHPEKYRDLMVRITGYSAVFVDMCTKAQNEIIRRDEVN